MKLVTTFIKQLKAMLFRFIQTKIIVIVIANCAVLLIVELSAIVKQSLKSMNTSFLNNLYDLENYLFTGVNQIFSTVEGALKDLKTKVETVLDTVSPDEIKLILTLINFAVWLELFIQSVVKSIKNGVQSIITTTLSPVLFLTGEISTTIQALETAFEQLETDINNQTHTLYIYLTQKLATFQTTYNNNLNIFFDSIESAFGWYNEGVNAIETASVDQKTVITNYNETINSIIEDIISDNFTNAESHLNRIPAISTTPLNIDYNQYRITLIPPVTLKFSPAMPMWEISLMPVRSCILDIQNSIQNLDTKIRGLPTQFENNFKNMFPAVFRSQLTNELTTLLQLAIAQLLMKKREAIKNKFTTLKTKIKNSKTETQNAAREKAKEIIGKIEDAEIELLKTIPDLIKPSIERYIDRIVKQVEKAKEEIQDEGLEVTDFLPDIPTIEGIMLTLPAITPKNNPLIKDSKSFAIQDIHRILCDNFSRNERLAILFALAPHDVRIQTSAIGNLILELN